jgi:hypothetical protein
LVNQAHRRGIDRRIALRATDLDGELSRLVQRQHVPAEMRDVGAVFTVEIHRHEKQPLVRLGLEDKLFLPVNLDHPIRVAKHV